jgi:hypothetical protein
MKRLVLVLLGCTALGQTTKKLPDASSSAVRPPVWKRSIAEPLPGMVA